MQQSSATKRRDAICSMRTTCIVYMLGPDFFRTHNDSVDVAYSVSTSFICIFTYPCIYAHAYCARELNGSCDVYEQSVIKWCQSKRKSPR